jgi:GMP synthase-like glutamine amidotransferase
MKPEAYPFPPETVNAATVRDEPRETGTDGSLPGVNAEAVPNPLALVIDDESKNRRLLGICLSSLLNNGHNLGGRVTREKSSRP